MDDKELNLKIALSQMKKGKDLVDELKSKNFEIPKQQEFYKPKEMTPAEEKAYYQNLGAMCYSSKDNKKLRK